VNPERDKEVEVNVKMNPIVDNIINEPIKEGSVIVLENIYYDFDKSAIRKGAARELDALVQLMKSYPSMEVEMIAHTDSRGGEDYNLDLSLRRAESARKYLIRNSIAESRIKAFGYGESQLRNDCYDGVDCTEEEHEYNRRTEVRITKIDEPVKVQYDTGKPGNGRMD
jgi:outer membrane protein OmpA-like peptidoglycan-associated protein